jgi:hypothetical protein
MPSKERWRANNRMQPTRATRFWTGLVVVHGLSVIQARFRWTPRGRLIRVVILGMTTEPRKPLEDWSQRSAGSLGEAARKRVSRALDVRINDRVFGGDEIEALCRVGG